MIYIDSFSTINKYSRKDIILGITFTIYGKKNKMENNKGPALKAGPLLNLKTTPHYKLTNWLRP